MRAASQTLRQVGNTALARRSRDYPDADFSRDGYVVREAFLDPAAAAGICADLQRFTNPNVKRTKVAGTFLRDRAKRQDRDLHVRQLTGAHKLSAGIAQFADSGRVEAAARELTGIDLHLGAMTVQIDWPDTETKRGLHVDSHWPPTYKAFIYLTDVSSPDNGPFSVVPGSHRHRAKKVRAIAGDVFKGRDHTDLDHTYDIAEATCLTGGPGTAIFADQRLAHAGWPGHTTGTRIMLVGYLYESGVEPPAFLVVPE